MKVDIVSIGLDWFFSGNVDKNSIYVTRECGKLGLEIVGHQVVGEGAFRISNAVKMAACRSDIVIVASDKKIEADLKNELIELGVDAKVFVLCGDSEKVEQEFKEKVVTYIEEAIDEVFFSQTIKLCGVGYLDARYEIEDLLSVANPKVEIYDFADEVHIRVTARAKSSEAAKNFVYPVGQVIITRFGENVFTTNEDETLEEVVVRMLKKKELTLTTAESCTAGMLSARIVNVSGASEVFKQGFVTYSNKSKRKQLDVDKSTLHKYGAVSKETAKEMAKGGVFNTDADICVSVTGLAGPEGEEGKPVGLVYIGCCINGKVIVNGYNFSGDRQQIRRSATTYALDMLRRGLATIEK